MCATFGIVCVILHVVSSLQWSLGVCWKKIILIWWDDDDDDEQVVVVEEDEEEGSY